MRRDISILKIAVLERRQLFAIDATFMGNGMYSIGELRIIEQAGSPLADDVSITVGGDNVVHVWNGAAEVIINNPWSSYHEISPNYIDRITIRTGDMNDVVDLSSLSPVLWTALVDVQINGGNGNDVLTGSPFADYINGDDWDGDYPPTSFVSANDVIWGMNGADTLKGNIGNDSIWGHSNTPNGTATDSNEIYGDLTWDAQQYAVYCRYLQLVAGWQRNIPEGWHSS